MGEHDACIKSTFWYNEETPARCTRCRPRDEEHGEHDEGMKLIGKPSLLERILVHKEQEVTRNKHIHPFDVLERSATMAPPIRDFARALKREPGRTAVIAEIKKASPSRGVFLPSFDPLAIAACYMANGAAAISILTDEEFFHGHLDVLKKVRAAQGSELSACPLLRKDFLIDPYQVYEARVAGADALLLIVGALDNAMLHTMLETTRMLGMQALVEVHTEDEVSRALEAGASIIGVNNRDLHTFRTSLETTERLARLLPSGPNRPILVSESGIATADDIVRLRDCGVDAVLVGEALVTAPNMGERLRELVMA